MSVLSDVVHVEPARLVLIGCDLPVDIGWFRPATVGPLGVPAGYRRGGEGPGSRLGRRTSPGEIDVDSIARQRYWGWPIAHRSGGMTGVSARLGSGVVCCRTAVRSVLVCDVGRLPWDL